VAQSSKAEKLAGFEDLRRGNTMDFSDAVAIAVILSRTLGRRGEICPDAS
jgi:hypothetical protein